MRKSKLRLDWWGSGMDWGELADSAVKRRAFAGGSISMTGCTSISRTKISQESSNHCHAKYAKET